MRLTKSSKASRRRNLTKTFQIGQKMKGAEIDPFRMICCGLLSVGCGNLIEDVCDSLVGLFACKGDDNCNDKAANEAGDDLVETG